MTRTDHEDRLAELQQQLQQAQANVQAIAGAIQEEQYWLGRYAADKTNADPPQPTPE